MHRAPMSVQAAAQTCATACNITAGRRTREEGLSQQAPACGDPLPKSPHQTPSGEAVSTFSCTVSLQGRVVEEGSPQELLARGGRYAELWARQASVDDVSSADAPAAPDTASDGDDKEQASASGFIS